MADMLRMTDLTLKNVENAQLYTLQVPQHVNESCSNGASPARASLTSTNIESLDLFGNFQLVFPENSSIEAEEVRSLFEALNNDVQGFDELVFEAINTVELVEATPNSGGVRGQETLLEIVEPESTASSVDGQNSKLDTLETQVMQVEAEHIDNAQAAATGALIQSEEKAIPVITSRFKKLNPDTLQEMESAVYSTATKRNTKWGIGVFNDITGTMAGLLFHKIEEHFTSGGLPKVKTLSYAESLFVLSECGMLKDMVEQAKVAKGITLNRMTLFDNVSTTAYNKSVSDSTLAKMASIAPNNLTPSQKVRFMEILSTGVPEDETLGRTSPALSQATCTSEDSQHSQSTELSTGKATVSWTHEAILLLVDRRRALSHLFDSSTVTGRQSWQKVADELRAKGHDYTCEDCRKKMVSLKMRHKTIKEKNGMTGERHNMWRYYGLMEEMFANDPAIIPKTVVCSLRQAQSAPSAAQSAPSAAQSAPSAAQSAPSAPINESSAGDMSVLEEESADLPFIPSTPRTGTRKRRRSGYDDEAPQWFEKYQQAQQKMHEEKMALESRRVSALETLVTLLQGQSANK